MLPAAPQKQTYTKPSSNNLKAGTWWKVVNANDPLFDKISGTLSQSELVLLLQEVHVIDGEPHSVQLHPHPQHNIHSIKMMIDDFLARFTFEPEGADIRAREQADVMDELRAMPEKLAAAQTQTLAPPSANTQETELSTKIAALPAPLQGKGGQKAVEDAQALITLSEQRQAALQKVTKDMEATAALLTRHQKEQVAVMESQISDDMKKANSTLQKLHTLTLFLGEHQHITPLKDGNSAPTNEKLHFFQKMLFLDEEFASHFIGQDFDWRQIDNLSVLFEKHPEVVEQILPQPRSVAICRVRRHAKALPGNPDMQSLLGAIQDIELDKALMILVRDGERLFMVEADQDTANAQRLFPSRAEIADLYKTRWNKQDITPQDLEYSKSRSEHDQRALFYKRFLVLFWGLHSRKGLFGDFMPKDANWFDPEVQGENFVFVHDEEDVLEKDGEGVLTWLERTNQMIGQGSRVIIEPKRLMNDETCPAAYEGEHRMQDPTEEPGLHIVESDGTSLFVRVHMKRSWSEAKPKRQKVYIRKHGRFVGYEGVLNMDVADTKTLSRFVHDRRDKVHYGQTFVLLDKALRTLSDEEPIETAMAHQNKTDLDTVRQARASVKWKPLDEKGLKSTQTALNKIKKHAKIEGRPYLVMPKTAGELKKWSHPELSQLDMLWWCLDEHTVCPELPTPSEWRTSGLGQEKGNEDLNRPEARAFFDRFVQSSAQMTTRASDKNWLQEQCQEIRRLTSQSRGRHVVRHNLGCVVGFAVLPTKHQGEPQVHVLSLSADPYQALTEAGGLEEAKAALRNLYAHPERHISQLGGSTVWTLNADKLSNRSPYEEWNTELGLDKSNTNDRGWTLNAPINDNDPLNGSKKPLLSAYWSQSVSVFELQRSKIDPEEKKKEIKDKISKSQVFIKKDVLDWMMEHPDFSHVTFDGIKPI